jgi:hypothetical protein
MQGPATSPPYPVTNSNGRGQTQVVRVRDRRARASRRTTAANPRHLPTPRRGGGRWRGHRGAEGYREWLTAIDAYIEWEVTLAEVTEIDHERVLAVIPTRFRGRQSGAEIDQRIAAVVTVREERWSALSSFSPLSRPSKSPGCGSSHVAARPARRFGRSMRSSARVTSAPPPGIARLTPLEGGARCPKATRSARNKRALSNKKNRRRSQRRKHRKKMLVLLLPPTTRRSAKESKRERTKPSSPEAAFFCAPLHGGENRRRPESEPGHV